MYHDEACRIERRRTGGMTAAERREVLRQLDEARADRERAERLAAARRQAAAERDEAEADRLADEAEAALRRTVARFKAGGGR